MGLKSEHTAIMLNIAVVFDASNSTTPHPPTIFFFFTKVQKYLTPEQEGNALIVPIDYNLAK